MIDAQHRQLVAASLRAAGVPPDTCAQVLELVSGRPRNAGAAEPLLLTQAETARLLQCSRFTVRRLVLDGRIRTVQLRDMVRYPRTEVEALARGDK